MDFFNLLFNLWPPQLWRPKEPDRGYMGLEGILKRVYTEEDPGLDRKNPYTCAKKTPT